MSDEKVWFVHRTGRDLVGPVAGELICRGFKEGKIPEDSIVAREGDDAWIPVGDLVARLDAEATRHDVSPFLTGLHPRVGLEHLDLPPRGHEPDRAPTSGGAAPGQAFMVFIPGSREPPRGPWSLDEIRERRETGALLATARVCRLGDARWEVIDEVIAPGEPAPAPMTTPTTGNLGSSQPSAVAEAPKVKAAPAGLGERWRGTPMWLRAAGGAGLVVALVTVWLSTRPGAESAPPTTSSSSEASAPPTASSAESVPHENELGAEAERQRLSDAEAEKAREQESICAAKGKWPLAPSLARVSALGPWVVTGHEMATERASKVTISELGGEKVATEIERLEKSVQEIDAHPLLPGEEKIKKQLLADFKSLIALNKRWRAAMVGYSGSLRPFDGLPEATTSTITKVSSNDASRLEACLDLAKVPSAADAAAPKPAPAPKKKACHACYYNGSCVRLGGSPCCEPIVEHVSEDPKEAAKCRQLGM